MPQGLFGEKPNIGVLVVEDNPDDEALTLRGLRRCGLPMEVSVARDGAEALDLLTGDLSNTSLAQAPRLVLLDLKLPKMGGLEVLEAVRANPRTATMPVVCMTSSDEVTDTTRSYGLGANSFVRKPIDYEDYLSTVAKTAEYWLKINFWPA